MIGVFKNAQKGMGSLTPALALISPAFWVAWIELIYSGEIHFGPEGPSSFDIIMNYTMSTSAMALMIIVFGFLAKRVERLLCNGAIVVAAGTLASLATFASLVAPSPIWTLLTGVFTSILATRFAQIYAGVNPKAAMVSIILSQIVASFIYGYVLSLSSFWQPLFLCLLPFIGGALSTLDGGEAGSAPSITEQKPTTNYLRLMCALFLFSVAINVVRGFYPSSVEADVFAAARGNTSIIFFFTKTALLSVVLLLPLRANLGKLCYYGLVALAIFTVPLPLVGLANATTLELFGCVNALLNIVVWSLFSGISYKSGRSPIRMFGWGWGALSLGSVVGWLLGLGLHYMGFDGSQRAMVEVALLLTMLLACMFIVTWQVVDALFDPFDDNADECGIDRTIGEKAAGADDDSDDKAINAACCATCPNAAVARLIADSEGMQQSRQSGGDQAGDIEPGAGGWQRAVFELSQDKQLSNREGDVAGLLLRGYTKQYIAEELFIAYNTVRSHVRKVYVKCDVHSQQELITLFERDYLKR